MSGFALVGRETNGGWSFVLYPNTGEVANDRGLVSFHAGSHGSGAFAMYSNGFQMMALYEPGYRDILLALRSLIHQVPQTDESIRPRATTRTRRLEPSAVTFHEDTDEPVRPRNPEELRVTNITPLSQQDRMGLGLVNGSTHS